MVELPFGRVTHPLDLGARPFTLVAPTPRPAPPALPGLLAEALDAPIGTPRVETMVRPGDRVTLIISDPSRAEPRVALIEALRGRVAGARWTLAIATGTHGPAAIDDLDLPSEFLADAVLVNHDGHRAQDLVELGVTARGTPVRLHRCVVEADLVIATGCIRPHYFAGFGAGVKAIFPGLGEASAIRTNHALKGAPRARAGIVDGNPCREDLEEAVAMVPTPTFLLNGVSAPDGSIHAVVAGDLRAAFRVGVERARPWFTVQAPRAPIVIASDALPVTATLYQAAKIVAAVAPLVEEGGTIVLVAECADGTGPLEVVNEAIFRIGILPRLPSGATIQLVSGLSAATVACTLVDYAPSIEAALHGRDGSVVVVPRASQLIVEATS